MKQCVLIALAATTTAAANSLVDASCIITPSSPLVDEHQAASADIPSFVCSMLSAAVAAAAAHLVTIIERSMLQQRLVMIALCRAADW